jgi:hypothetical protein
MVRDGAENVRNNLVDDPVNSRIRALALEIGSGKYPEAQMILVAEHPRAQHIILEGHTRATAYALANPPIEESWGNRRLFEGPARLVFLLMPTALDNGQRSPRKLLRAVIARLLGWKSSWLSGKCVSACGQHFGDLVELPFMLSDDLQRESP